MTTQPVYAPWSGHVPAPGKRTPVTMYRLQLNADFTCADAQKVLPYLTALGITDIYLSPVLQAAPGSMHGYDVVDHSRISESIGGRKALEALCDDAHKRGLGVVVDIVPNHMAVPTPAWHNRALWSVMRLGPESPYANWFDLSLDEPLLMPILGDRLGDVLAREELVLERRSIPSENGEEQWVLRYFDHVFPVAPGTESLPIHVLVDKQHYRLAYWKVGDEELNYRRFFDVGSLAAIRVEIPEVFNATHALILELVNSGHIDALRVDHPDGLADPAGYMERLSEATGGLWIAAEKILAPHESLPSSWPVAGTTGYDVSWRIDQLHCDPAGALHLGAVMNEIAGDAPIDYESVVDDAKREVISSSLSAEVDRLAGLLHDAMSADVRLRDHTVRDVRACLVELLVAARRYRAYVLPSQDAPTDAVRLLSADAERARAHLDEDRWSTLDVVVDLLLGQAVGSEGLMDMPSRTEAVIRFQQVCGAVTAKGVEDTAFYRWTHLCSLTEVGGEPEGFALMSDEAHTWAKSIGLAWPATMATSSTHDTKRGEDVRARINALSSFGPQWIPVARALAQALRDHGLSPAVSGRSINLMVQTLVGTWAPDSLDPMTPDRLSEYFIKAAREQKMWTAWTAPDEDAERSVRQAVESVFTDDEVIQHLKDWAELTEKTVRTIVLSAKAMVLTWVGVSDIYQGSEITRTSLVDPDNRRAVDFQELSSMLEALDSSHRPSSLDEEKLALTAALVRLRARRCETFVGSRSGYVALPVTTSHAFSYARTRDGQADVVVIIERLSKRLDEVHGWQDHRVVLPDGQWRVVVGASVGLGFQHATDVYVDGGDVPLAVLMDSSPVCVLERITE
ncbi:malto-oligosyltrehalose synthase [Actinomyces vulturis]|uniref:malto-oligosyltrehalose synthase n=1 Tax=Actinomyces vulturis TaxID=1857645 RepID=UPI00082984BD|nr:malto-oligosyltrehalose synthase [Actinomyces vulturis]